jgi:solute carrier family 35 protein E1
MPHSTRTSSISRASIPTFKFPGDTKTGGRTSMEKFPDLVESLDEKPFYPSSPTKANNGIPNGAPSGDRWQPRRDSILRGSGWNNGPPSTGGRHNKQKSLSDAFRTIRTRKASVTANVHEIGDALKAPVSPRLIVRNPSSQNKFKC